MPTMDQETVRVLIVCVAVVAIAAIFTSAATVRFLFGGDRIDELIEENATLRDRLEKER